MKRKSRPSSGIQVEIIKVLCSVETQLFLFVSPTPPASVRSIIPSHTEKHPITESKRNFREIPAYNVLYEKNQRARKIPSMLIGRTFMLRLNAHIIG